MKKFFYFFLSWILLISFVPVVKEWLPQKPQTPPTLMEYLESDRRVMYIFDTDKIKSSIYDFDLMVFGRKNYRDTSISWYNFNSYIKTVFDEETGKWIDTVYHEDTGESVGSELGSLFANGVFEPFENISMGNIIYVNSTDRMLKQNRNVGFAWLNGEFDDNEEKFYHYPISRFTQSETKTDDDGNVTSVIFEVEAEVWTGNNSKIKIRKIELLPEPFELEFDARDVTFKGFMGTDGYVYVFKTKDDITLY